MPVADSRIPVSTGLRRKLKVMKALEDFQSYDALLRELIEESDWNAKRGGGDG